MADEIEVLKGVLLELDAARERIMIVPDMLLQVARTQDLRSQSLAKAGTEAISDAITDIGRAMGAVHEQIAILKQS